MGKTIQTRLTRIFGVFFVILFSFLCYGFSFDFSIIKRCEFVGAISRDFTDTEILELSNYDSRDYGIVTSVKDQGSSSLCWAYSAISASETSILKSGIDKTVSKDSLSLSPTSIGYGRYNRPADPLNNVGGEANGTNWLNSPGQSAYAGILMSQWWGPISSSLSASTNAYENSLYRLKNMVTIYDEDTFDDFDTRILEMKKAIAKYGAITFSYNNLRETPYYNPKRETSNGSSFHACTIIGWDDNISASSFVPSGTEKNGGWLVKNSYTSLPYFWLSYECESSNIYAFDFSNGADYDYNYFYDDSLYGGWTMDLKTQYVANVFEAKKSTSDKDEYLKAVNIAFACKNTTATINIYTNLTDTANPESGELKATKKQIFEQSGYRTIVLDDLVKIEKGKKFSIVVQLSSTSSSSPYVSTSQGNGLCYRKNNGNWSKINNNALRIKGYTVLGEQQIDEPLIVDINNATISAIPNCTYTGDEIKPNVELTYNGTTLIENSDYTISYSNNINASSFAKITITGLGTFDGEREVLFTIDQAEKPNIFIPKTIDNLRNFKTLKLITLPSDFVWQDPDFELKNGLNEVVIVYNNQDKANYKNIAFTVKVDYVEIAEPEIPEENPADKDYADDETEGEELSDYKLVLFLIGGCGLGGITTAGVWLFVRKIKRHHKI